MELKCSAAWSRVALPVFPGTSAANLPAAPLQEARGAIGQRRSEQRLAPGLQPGDLRPASPPNSSGPDEGTGAGSAPRPQDTISHPFMPLPVSKEERRPVRRKDSQCLLVRYYSEFPL